MTNLQGTVWRSKRNPALYVRVSENGESDAFVQSCSADGRVWFTFGGGGLTSRPRKVRLNADGSGLLRYTRVEQVAA